MAIGADFSVAANGDIRHIANTDHYTVLELHRWLQDLADDEEAVVNDLIDITTFTPSERSTDNIITLLDHSASGGPTFNIDDTAAEYFYGGSITQDGGDEVYSGLRVLGAVNNTATQLMVIQDNDLYQYTTTPASPFWGTQAAGGYNGNATGGVLMRILVKSRAFGADLDAKQIRVQARHWGDSYDFFNVTLGQGESVAAIGTTPDAQNDTTQGTVTVWTDVLNSGGTANAPTGGYQTIDLNDGNGAEPYYSQWTYGAQGTGLKALWEYGKDLTGNGTAKTVDGIAGELFLGITHDMNYTGEATGPFQERETLVWGTTIVYGTLAGGTFAAGDYVTIGAIGAAGRVMYDNGTTTMVVALDDPTITVSAAETITIADGVGAVTASVSTVTDNAFTGGSGVLLALNDAGTTGDLWIQLITGGAPADTLEIRGLTSAATADISGAPVARTIPKIYLGSYTGSLIGAFGLGVDPNDLVATDGVTNLLGNNRTPPNNQQFQVFGLVSAEDRVLVAPRTGSVIDFAQLTLATTLSGAETQVDVGLGNIPVDTPSTGTIRVEEDSGIYKYVAYTAVDATFQYFTVSDTFTLSTAPCNVMITYIDKIAGATSESVTLKYNADRNLFVRVRDGGATPIKTYESDNAVFSSTGGSASASRIADD